jgi:hypothetical protein
MKRRFDLECLGVRWQAKRDTALASTHACVSNKAALYDEPTKKRRRRCALPAHSMSSEVHGPGNRVRRVSPHPILDL